MFKKVVVIFGGRQGDRILELARRWPQDIGHLLSSLFGSWVSVGVSGAGLEFDHFIPLESG